MIIVSNEKINKDCRLFLSYDEFVQQAYSENGLDTDNDEIAININDLNFDVFEDVKELEEIVFFTLDGSFPAFAKSIKVENWSSFSMNSNNSNENFDSISDSIVDLLNQSSNNDLFFEEENDKKEQKEARIVVFGSSKGGSGKTFTTVMSTYRYAKTHPDERIALVDFDILDGQVGVSIHRVKPTMANYYIEYQKGYKDFQTMNKFCVKANKLYPSNVDFYLAPPSTEAVENEDFWFNIIDNCINNYDLVVFDTGIDYLNITPISYAYKIADKINLLTTTSIKSVNSIVKQISRLKGEIPSPGRIGGKKVSNVFSKDDELESRLNLIITQMVQTDNFSRDMNKTVYKILSEKCNVIATFGVITDSVSQAEFYGRWYIFDNNAAVNKSFDTIMS